MCRGDNLDLGCWRGAALSVARALCLNASRTMARKASHRRLPGRRRARTSRSVMGGGMEEAHLTIIYIRQQARLKQKKGEGGDLTWASPLNF